MHTDGGGGGNGGGISTLISSTFDIQRRRGPSTFFLTTRAFLRFSSSMERYSRCSMVLPSSMSNARAMSSAWVGVLILTFCFLYCPDWTMLGRLMKFRIGSCFKIQTYLSLSIPQTVLSCSSVQYRRHSPTLPFSSNRLL